MLKGLQVHTGWRVLLMPDHATPVGTRIHSADPIPFILLDSSEWADSDSEVSRPFSEKTAKDSGIIVENAPHLMEMLLNKTDGAGKA